MNIGYARVSTTEQNLDAQRDALRAAGCERIFEEKASGGKSDRPELLKAFDYAREGDTITVQRLDRLGRSLKDLIDLVAQLDARKVGFRSLNENIDTTTAGGRLVFHLFAALAEFERALIRERTQAGLAASRARGRVGGRKPLLTPEKQRIAQSLRDDPTQSVGAICKTLGISRTTFYAHTKGKDAPG